METSQPGPLDASRRPTGALNSSRLLHGAVLSGSVSALARLLAEPCDPNALLVIEYFGAVSLDRDLVLEVAECTPLMLAAAIGYPACVRELLPVSDVGARNGAGMSALTFAARGGHALCIRMLLHGEGARVASHDREAALMEAARHSRLEALGLLAPHSRAALIESAFKEAIRAQRPGVVLALLPHAPRDAIEAAVAEAAPVYEPGASPGNGRTGGLRELARERIARILRAGAIAQVETLDCGIPTIGAGVETNGVVQPGRDEAGSVV